ncbi:sensor histidine kinase [Ectobacillus ponti]|uniref:Heme sensor protein HssS n=1 Tax=Ectobacillus ponti TaxID=2961894 RepID=A0AA42BRI5_9BACI|nr:HAMP domain-containing sensor histidine kinase [Ectobacillus ponti]MCP8970436.1 HAMP domain-containing histidine kinase [Ectobacillus ponti]
MRTLYIRFVAVTLGIMVLSSIFAFLLGNLFYQTYLKPYNDRKITDMALHVQAYMEALPRQQAEAHFRQVAALGYQLYIEGKGADRHFYGSPFREQHISSRVVEQVKHGQVYHGIRQFSERWFVTGFFEDSLANTIGVPVTIEGTTYALFLRPDIEKQFWEMRIFFSILLAGTVLLSMLLVTISTRYIVKPIRIFTKATKKIASGEYDIELAVNRRDEIGELARHFSHMAEALNRLEQMRQEFISNVSHEIQSPLTSIQGYAQVLRSQPVSHGQQQQYLHIIEEESRRMSLLSKQMLLLASLDQEEHIVDQQPFHLAEQLQGIVRATEWQWREKELAIELDAAPVLLRGNKELLHQAWTNLLINSIKFTEPGGSISICAVAGHREVQLEFSDTGIGIAEEDLKRIFEPYYKADASRNRAKGGSGLGLAITQKIIALHGGSITVQSKPGEGTRFTVILPQL